MNWRIPTPEMIECAKQAVDAISEDKRGELRVALNVVRLESSERERLQRLFRGPIRKAERAMSEIQNYQDPRLQPEPEREWGPVECMDSCKHSLACRMQLERLCGYEVDGRDPYWEYDLARKLGCSEWCECIE